MTSYIEVPAISRLAAVVAVGILTGALLIGWLDHAYALPSLPRAVPADPIATVTPVRTVDLTSPPSAIPAPTAQIGAPRAAPTSTVNNAPAVPRAAATVPVLVPPVTTTALPVAPATPTMPTLVTVRPSPSSAPTPAPTAPVDIPGITLPPIPSPPLGR